MGSTIDELNQETKKALVEDVLEKKNGASDKDWAELVTQYNLSVAPDTLRKAGVGVKLVQDAGLYALGGGAAYRPMEQNQNEPVNDSVNEPDNYVERQKIRDLTRQLTAAYRAESRTQLLRETVDSAIQSLPSMDFPIVSAWEEPHDERELVLGIGDFHYGADIDVRGLYGEYLNRYNSDVFEKRMEELLRKVKWIVEREGLFVVHVMMVGDLIDGILRQSQLMRLEYGLVESVIHLSEYLAKWLNELSKSVQRVYVYGVTGNHSEVRPLKAKAREFEEENLEKIIFWYLASRLKENERVIIDEECGRMKKVSVCGYSFVLLHGDGEKSISDIARSTVNLYGEKIDYFLCGHLHKEQEFPSGATSDGNSTIIRVPSLCGMDKYAQSRGFGGQAGATAMVMVTGVGREVVYPLTLAV